jgi:hypothetical protein
MKVGVARHLGLFQFIFPLRTVSREGGGNEDYAEDM